MSRLRGLVETVLLAAAGGALFTWLELPIPWMLGALCAVAAANMFVHPVTALPGDRYAGQAMLGTVIGLQFTPEVATVVAAHLPWMALVAACSVATAGLGVVILRRIAGLDAPTAFFGSVPGGMIEMLNLGERANASLAPLVVAQLVRVTVVIFTVPAALTYFGEHGSQLFVAAHLPVRWPGLIALLGGAAGLAYLLFRLRVPNAWMLAPCGLAALLTVFDVPPSGVPPFLSPLAQVLLGMHMGRQFRRGVLAGTPRVVVGAAIMTLVMIAVGIGLAVAVASATGSPVTTMIAATTPGGVSEMSVTGQVLGLGVPLITAYHLTRLLMITALVPMIFWGATRLAAGPRRRASQ